MPKALRVLLLEDSPQDAELMLHELERAGFAVESQRVQTRDGFAAALSPQLDLVLADYTLPEFNGSEALAMLRATGLDVPFILVTGTLTEEQAVAIMMQGAFAAVLKDRLAGLGPFAVRALEERDVRRENRRVHGALTSELDFRRTLEESMLAGLLSFDLEGRITHANAAASRLFGYPREELLAMRPPFPFWAGEATPEKAAHFREMVQGKPVRGYRCACRRRNGAQISLAVDSSPLFDGAGRPAGSVAFLYDITEQVKAEENLRRQARTLRLLSLCNEALVRANSEPELLEEVCRVIAEEGGYPMAWVALRADSSLRIAAKAGQGSDYVDDLRATWTEGSGGGSPTGIAIREGRTVVCRHSATDSKLAPWCSEALKRGYRAAAALPLRQNGHVFGALMIYGSQAEAFGEQEMALLTELAQDLAYGITALHTRAARESAEAARAESERKFRALWDRNRDALMVIGEKTFIDCNDATLRLFGCRDKAEFCSMHPSQVSPAAQPDGTDSRTAADRRIATAMKEGTCYFEWLHKRIDTNAAFPAEVLFSRIELEGRAFLQATVRDISERRRLEEAVLHSQKMESIGRLAGGVAHDFNNLLMVILANCGFVLKSLAPEDPRRKDVEDIKEAAERAAALTRQLLIFSRKQVVLPEIQDLSALTRNLEKMLERLIGEDIKIVESFCPEPLPVRIAPGQLEQAITNLAVNARDAMPKGGTLRLRTRLVKKGETDCPPDCARRCTGACARLEIEDDGIGMPPEVQEHLFEPFFTTKPTGKGTGLGLSTVYGIVRQADGAVLVKSAPGRGTIFTISLACEADAAPAAGAPAGASAAGGRETILLAEDEEAVRRVDARILRERGYEVLETASGKEALSRLKERPVDLLLSDVVMPEMSGPELASQARALKPELKVLFMSGYPEREELARLKTFDGELLPKPVTAEELALKVRQVLDRKPPARPGA